jgi:hypothetical protein
VLNWYVLRLVLPAKEKEMETAEVAVAVAADVEDVPSSIVALMIGGKENVGQWQCCWL